MAETSVPDSYENLSEQEEKGTVIKARKYFAHSENLLGIKQTLEEHLAGTSNLAESFSPHEKYKQLFRLTGLLHDIGKYQQNFQAYLEFGKPKTQHSPLGAYAASILIKNLLPIQFAILGHHAGMHDNEYRRNSNKVFVDKDNLANYIIGLFNYSFPSELINFNSNNHELPDDVLETECLTRFLFSALTDADWLNTENHFKPDISLLREPLQLDYSFLIDILESKFAKLPLGGEINELRTRARDEITGQYSQPLGFFSLQLPTGLGKTLSSLYWALLHAQYHKLQRIIIVLPYISIIDQTSQILKDLFGDDLVLEHHSGNMEEDSSYNNEEKSNISKQLACENWDAPIIITTSVQFFESLFSNKPSKTRKIHNIAHSVIIFDEIQTLPKHYAEPVVVMLKNIAAIAGASFLFCTATQPAFKNREGFNGIDDINPLIQKPEYYFERTKRVDYELLNNLEEVSVDNLFEKIKAENDSLLVILNTKSAAKLIYSRLKELKTYKKYYHLSTSMCPHHRKMIIENIIQDLKDGKRIAVVSTQLVEAGVDLDFPVVYRALAPLDALIQSAGRCNRNGTLKIGRVIIFLLENQKMPDTTYKALTDWTKITIKDNPNVLHAADSYEKYYEFIMRLLIQADKYKIDERRKSFDFKTVSESFKIIESQTETLFIKNYSNESMELFKIISESEYITKEMFRKLQQFSVQVYPLFISNYSNQIELLKNSLRIWMGEYDMDIGIAPGNIETVF